MRAFLAPALVAGYAYLAPAAVSEPEPASEPVVVAVAGDGVLPARQQADVFIGAAAAPAAVYISLDD